jgi:intein/homing endonuclease
MKHENIKPGDKVVYIPKYLLMGPKNEMVKESNLGIVTSKNDRYVFVLYKYDTIPKATEANDLYTLKERLDLAAKL